MYISPIINRLKHQIHSHINIYSTNLVEHFKRRTSINYSPVNDISSSITTVRKCPVKYSIRTHRFCSKNQIKSRFSQIIPMSITTNEELQTTPLPLTAKKAIPAKRRTRRDTKNFHHVHECTRVSFPLLRAQRMKLQLLKKKKLPHCNSY